MNDDADTNMAQESDRESKGEIVSAQSEDTHSLPYGLGGTYLTIVGSWSDKEQAKFNRFFEQWVKMLEDEIREKEATIIEIMARLNLQDEKISARVQSREYQSLVKKTFRDWSGAESEEKRIFIRNILSNAAASTLTSDDVVRDALN